MKVLERTGYWAWLEAETESDPEAATRLGNLQELLNAVKEFEEKAGADGRLDHYLEGVALQSGADTIDQKSCVTLMTVHLAKGLEYPVVFLTGLEEGLFPIGSGSSSPDELEEERRLCYVGMTRARELLILTYAATRRMFGQTYTNLPSRFILEGRLFGDPSPRPASGHGAGPAAGPAVFGRGLPAAAGHAHSGGLPGGATGRHGAVKVGSRVRHPEFGRGKVVEKAGSGEASKVTVAFDSGKVKKLILQYAPLELE